MSYNGRIDVSEGTDVNKASTSRECIICHYWYFLDKGFRSQPAVCNGCMNLKNNAISNIYRVGYCYIINRISESESEALILLQNAI